MGFHQNQSNPLQLQQAFVEMAVPQVNKKLLDELEAMGFPRPRATRALHFSGNSSLEAAIEWVIDHENDSDIDQMPLVAVDINLDSPQTFHITEQMKIKAQELRNKEHKKKEVEEKKLERQREKERIRASKDLTEAKRILESNEKQRYLALKKKEKEEEKRAREKILKKLEHDKVERRSRLGLPPESPSVKPSTHLLQEKTLQTSLPLKSVTNAERMRECLRSLKRNHQNDGARVRRAFETLLIYVGNIAKNPDEEKFRKIRLTNPLFQDRVGNLRGGMEFLELCGFERTEGDEFLYLPDDKVDMEILNTAGAELKSAMTNPFFGLLTRTDTKLSELGDLSSPKLEFRQLVALLDEESDEERDLKDNPLLSIQFTQFGCGSLALASRVNHCTLDGVAVRVFEVNWAALTRGDNLLVVPNSDLTILSKDMEGNEHCSKDARGKDFYHVVFRWMLAKELCHKHHVGLQGMQCIDSWICKSKCEGA
ncbi:hypothetical protein CMV_008939 [Castanea mollissima]|uniref:UBA domain-containing protein n=1 Tax=Castanea mollissima TaxID=60419 RepID=A0A8J4R7S9_9ROSI|nr:hypothetical protein CMV_008939 [Castanea mollissima]